MKSLYRNHSSGSSNYIELLLKQPLNTPPVYRPDRGARSIRHPLALTLNCNDASKPICIVQYNPVHLKGKQTMICFRTPETVFPLQIGCTSHNYPFFSLVYLSSVLKMNAYMAYAENDSCHEQQRIPSVDRQQQNYYDRKGRSRHGNAQKA